MEKFDVRFYIRQLINITTPILSSIDYNCTYSIINFDLNNELNQSINIYIHDTKNKKVIYSGAIRSFYSKKENNAEFRKLRNFIKIILDK